MSKITLVAFATLFLFGCTTDNDATQTVQEVPNVFEIVARGLTFEAPDEVASGWTTFRFTNESQMVHFALIERLPEGTNLQRQQDEVAPVFQEGMDLLNVNQVDSAMAAFGKLPEWFGDIVFLGGPGLVSAGGSAEATVHLDPGTYLIECYVKTNGVFHSYNPDPDTYGMMHQFTVTDFESGNTEPTASVSLSISSEQGIEIEGTLEPGENTIAVHFTDQVVHENFVGHDIHLVRLEEDTDLEELGMWMDWTQPTGLQVPAPVVFLGGINEMPANETAYLTVDLEPGRYAWIAEVPNPAEKGMLITFSVPAQSGDSS